MKSKIKMSEIKKAIKNASPQEQQRLLKDLPHLLKISSKDLQGLKLAEPSFAFWDNAEDDRYNTL
jgi:hypothetical protein